MPLGKYSRYIHTLLLMSVLCYFIAQSPTLYTGGKWNFQLSYFIMIILYGQYSLTIENLLALHQI